MELWLLKSLIEKKKTFKYEKKKLVICLNYAHFENQLRSVIVSQNHYLNQIFDVHPLYLVKQKIKKLYEKRAVIFFNGVISVKKKILVW